MEPRKVSFYDKDTLNMTKVEEAVEYLASHLTLKEILKTIREISYDMVSYYDDVNKGIIYNGEYSDNHIWQATRLQRRLRDICDLFGQSIIDKNEFNNDYLEKYVGDGGDHIIQAMENKIAQLEQKIAQQEPEHYKKSY